MNSLASGTKVLVDTASQCLPGKWGREPPTAYPCTRHLSSEHYAWQGTRSEHPPKFRAVVTFVVIANLELQLCLKRSPQSKLGSPTLLILGLLLLALLWEPLLIIMHAMGRLGQENKNLAPPLPLTSVYHWHLSSFLFCESRLGAIRFLCSSESTAFRCASLPVFFILFALLFACGSTLCVSLYFYPLGLK